MADFMSNENDVEALKNILDLDATFNKAFKENHFSGKNRIKSHHDLNHFLNNEKEHKMLFGNFKFFLS